LTGCGWPGLRLNSADDLHFRSELIKSRQHPAWMEHKRLGHPDPAQIKLQREDEQEPVINPEGPFELVDAQKAESADLWLDARGRLLINPSTAAA
jgi:hypothetical protein